MNRYETIKKIHNINTLIALGIVPVTVLDWVLIYEYYLSERDKNKKMQSYCNTAEKYKISEVHVMNVVKWMECC